ncbi:MAG: MFS transporter [Kiritimatiellales bacterium]
MRKFRKAVRSLTTPAAGCDSSELRRWTQRLSIWEGSLWAVMWGFGESYIAPFALFLNAGSMVMALIGSGPVLIAALAQLAGAAYLDRIGRRLPIMLAGAMVQAIAYLPLFILPLLLPFGGMAALLIAVTVCFFSLGMSVPSWMSLMGDVVDQEERGNYFGRRTRTILYIMLASMMLAGWIISRWKTVGHPAVGFGFLFSMAFLARLISLFFMRRHYDAPLQKTADEARFSFLEFVRATPRSNFAKFAFTVALMNGAAQIAGPFFPVYMLRDLHWSYLQFTINMAVFLLAQTLFVRWWGALGDRHGNRAILAANCWLMTVLPLFWIVSTNYYVLLLGQVVSGACWSGFNLAAGNFIYDAVTQAKRARVFSYYNLLIGLFSVGGAVLIGAPLAAHAPETLHLGRIDITLRSSLLIVFAVSILARIAVARLMLPQFKEVRDSEPISTTQILWRLGEPLFTQAGEFIPLIRKIYSSSAGRNEK